MRVVYQRLIELVHGLRHTQGLGKEGDSFIVSGLRFGEAGVRVGNETGEPAAVTYRGP